MQDRWRKFVVPAAAGLLLVPAAAVAGVRMMTASSAQSAEDAPTVAPVVVAAETESADPTAVACGDEAAQMLADEQAGTLDPIGQAALDALRPICEQVGMPLPPAPRPDPVVVTQQVPVPAPSAGAPAVAAPVAPSEAQAPVSRRDDDHDDDEHDDDDHDEDDDRDDDSDDHDDDSDDHDEDDRDEDES